MPFGLALSFANRVTPTVGAVARGLAPARLLPIIGRAAVNVWRGHLFDLNRTRPNQIGGRRTGFYAQAARSASFEVAGDNSVVVSANSVGIAQRFYGGTIRPKLGKKYLTIPVAPEAYGKTAREFPNLQLVFGHGGQPIALATPSTRAVQITQNKRGKIVKQATGRLGVIMFRLVKSVTQQPDPTVIPSAETFDAKIGADLDAYTARLVERANSGGGTAP